MHSNTTLGYQGEFCWRPRPLDVHSLRLSATFFFRLLLVALFAMLALHSAGLYHPTTLAHLCIALWLHLVHKTDSQPTWAHEGFSMAAFPWHRRILFPGSSPPAGPVLIGVRPPLCPPPRGGASVAHVNPSCKVVSSVSGRWFLACRSLRRLQPDSRRRRVSQNVHHHGRWFLLSQRSHEVTSVRSAARSRFSSQPNKWAELLHPARSEVYSVGRTKYLLAP